MSLTDQYKKNTKVLRASVQVVIANSEERLSAKSPFYQ
jgi:hypothetical protein